MSSDRHKPFHILHVVHSLVIGGAERVVCDLTRHFNGGGSRTFVCCLEELGEFGKDLIEEGIPVRVFKRRPGIDYRLIRSMRRLYGEWKIDLVHAHQYTPYFYAAAACLGSSVPRAVFTEHGRHQPDHVRPKRIVFNQVLRLVTRAYTAVSDFTRQSLIEFEKMPRSRIRVIYNGVRDSGREELPTKEESRKKLGIGMDRKVVLSIGRMDPVKDFETLIRAFAAVVRDIPHVMLLIAGGGDGRYTDELRRYAVCSGIGDRVTFLGSRRDIPDLLAACDVFTLTSITESASMTILEAMAAGRPVVATRTGGNPELVVHGDSGYLVPVGDHRGVSEALTRIMACPDLLRKMENAGRARFQELFTLDKTLTAYKELYEEVLKG